VPYGVNATYMTESFETNIRATAVGGAYNLGRVGAAVGPALIGLIATNYSIGLGLAVMGGAYLLTAAIPAFGIREKMFDPQEREAPSSASDYELARSMEARNAPASISAGLSS
jgi:AAHS family cis,cis-muconate transporter-like MFS transporter